MSRLENKKNNAKNEVTSTVKLALHQDLQDLVLEPPKRQVREGGSKRFYIWRNMIKAITFYFRNLEPAQSLHRFVKGKLLE